MGIVSGRFGDFAPHSNLGAAIRGGDDQTSALLATEGFYNLISSWATFAFYVISQWQLE